MTNDVQMARSHGNKTLLLVLPTMGTNGSTMSGCDHFWSAYYMVEPKVAERRCFYCDETEVAGIDPNPCPVPHVA